jgi:hypothetical protein
MALELSISEKWKVSNSQLLDIFRRHIGNFQSLDYQVAHKNAGLVSNSNIRDGELLI